MTRGKLRFEVEIYALVAVKRSYVMCTGKKGPTEPNFGYGFQPSSEPLERPFTVQNHQQNWMLCGQIFLSI